MRKFKSIICVLIIILNAGCATITKGSRQALGVSSSPIGATFTVEGMTHTTPAIVRLSRKTDHIVVFHQEGYEDASGTISSNSNGWIWGNLLIYPLFPITALIDYMTGAGCSLSPREIYVTLREKVKK